jgi:hypothetical protein
VRGLLAAVLVLLMAVGSIVMWLGVPAGTIYGASQLVKSSAPNGAVYVGILVAIIVGMAVVGKLLGVLNQYHASLTNRIPKQREQTVWLKSMRADRTATREHGILGSVMAVSVSVALVLFGIWFFFFAEGGGI